MKKIIFITFLFLYSFCDAQIDSISRYEKIIKKANILVQSKQYKKAGALYNLSLKYITNLKKIDVWYDWLNAANCWSSANYPDSAFFYLNKMIPKENNIGYDRLLEYEFWIMKSVALKTIQSDKRWKEIMNVMEKSKNREDVKINKFLKIKLDSIAYIDQKYRSKINSTKTLYGENSKEFKDILYNIRLSDSLNLIEVSKILDNYGWLGAETIGTSGNSTLFFIVLHSKLEVQEKYLPLMKEATNSNKAYKSQLALLEDRIALGNGKKQIYGSQVKINPNGTNSLEPIEDEINVNKRRANVGLEPLEKYLIYFGIKYKLPKEKNKSFRP